MPSYDYRCTGCSTQFQVRHRVNDPDAHCPLCGAAAQRVILAAPAIHGRMARGREAAVRTLATSQSGTGHGPGCPCCH